MQGSLFKETRNSMDSNSPSSGHPAMQNEQSGSNRSDPQPLTKADLAIVAFVSSLWLWAAVWAITAPVFR
jgi:hypothetical protein